MHVDGLQFRCSLIVQGSVPLEPAGACEAPKSLCQGFPTLQRMLLQRVKARSRQVFTRMIE